MTTVSLQPRSRTLLPNTTIRTVIIGVFRLKNFARRAKVTLSTHNVKPKKIDTTAHNSKRQIAKTQFTRLYMLHFI